MRKFGLFIVVFVIVIFYNSCTKDKAKQPPSILCTSVAPATNTYNLRIKSYMDTYCGVARGCHDVGSYQFAGGGILIDDYQSTKNVFQSGKGLCSIKGELGCFAMPNSPYPKLADSLITYIQCWTENGYQQ